MIKAAILTAICLALLAASGAFGYRAGVNAEKARTTELETARRTAADLAAAAWDAAADQIERARLAIEAGRDAQIGETMAVLREKGGGDEKLDDFWRTLDSRLR